MLLASKSVVSVLPQHIEIIMVDSCCNLYIVPFEGKFLLELRTIKAWNQLNRFIPNL